MDIFIGLILRHVLGALGGFLVAKGYFAADDQTLTELLGAASTLAAGAWSVFQKYKAGLIAIK